MFQNADFMTTQIFDLADKLEQAEGQLGRGSPTTDKGEDKLTKATKDGSVIWAL